ncbi:MAG: FixH family protein [Desulfuromonadales bacterium]|jgi:hypothetical protein|nr:FixH family protein [Desulfuromonadales bacterium]
MIHKTFLFLLFFSLSFTLSAMQVADAAENGYRATSALGKSYELRITSLAAQVMKPVPFVIIVSNQEGTPVSGATISCSLTMPAMAMPSNKPPVKELDEVGHYKGMFLLTMGGLWNVELLATYSSGEQDSVVIPISAVSSKQSGASDVETKLEELFQKQVGAAEK